MPGSSCPRQVAITAAAGFYARLTGPLGLQSAHARTGRRGRAPRRGRGRARPAPRGRGRRHRPRRRGRAVQGARQPLRRRRARPRSARDARRRRLPRARGRAARHEGPHAHGGARTSTTLVDGPRARRRRLPAQAVPLRRAGRAPARAGPPQRRRPPARAAAPATSSSTPRGATATRAGRAARAHPKEFGVLEALLAADGASVSAEELLERVWDEHADPFTNTVRMTVMTLRRKLGDPPVVHTVRGRRLPRRDGPMRSRRSDPAASPRLYAALFVGARRGAARRLLLARARASFDRTLPADAAATRSRRPARPVPARAGRHDARGGRARLGRGRPGADGRCRRITATARRVSQERLDERIALGGPQDELRELARHASTRCSTASPRRSPASAGSWPTRPRAAHAADRDARRGRGDAGRSRRRRSTDLREMGETVRDAADRREALLDGAAGAGRARDAGLRAPRARRPGGRGAGARPGARDDGLAASS